MMAMRGNLAPQRRAKWIGGMLVVMLGVHMLMFITLGNSSSSDWLWFVPVLVMVVMMALMMFVVGPRMMRHAQGRGSEDTPSEILRKRYASGELTKQQYEEMEQTLRDHITGP
jgi:uncharacterized membrane protein